MESEGINSESLKEIGRLSELGFEGWTQDSNGIFTSDKNSTISEDISFPESAYEHEFVNLDSFWVYCRAKMIHRAIESHNVKLIWEIGAGSGSVAIPISKEGISVIATEPYYSGVQNIAKSKVTVFHASLKDLNIPNDSINAVGIFDVLEHIENPRDFLHQIWNFLASNGYIFVTVPAHQWLFSDFDTSIGHFRRYSLANLDKELLESGFQKVERRYFFSLLVLPAFILRRIPYLFGRRRSFEGKKGTRLSSNRLFRPTNAINEILKKLLLAESRLRLPFGLSVIGVYRKA